MAIQPQVQADDILDILKNIQDGAQDIVSANMVQNVQVSDGEILFMIEVDPARGPAMEDLRQKAERAVAEKTGYNKVTAILTAQKKAKTPDPHGIHKNPRLDDLPIKKIIAVASGKGGVGKSTVAFNLAYALAQGGQSVGLMDADIYGPSVPTISGLPNTKPEFDENQKIIPHSAHGLKVMSMGFLVDQDTPMIWRGPMVQTAVYQMLRDVAWGSDDAQLDVLIIDMPPGTGDAQLTLAQKVPVAGAVIVSTPQDLALIDAKKAVAMFRKVDVPILGLIENMSFYICPSCGNEDHIFGHGGAREEAERLGIPFLGEIPLSPDIRKAADEGRPLENEILFSLEMDALKTS